MKREGIEIEDARLLDRRVVAGSSLSLLMYTIPRTGRYLLRAEAMQSNLLETFKAMKSVEKGRDCEPWFSGGSCLCGWTHGPDLPRETVDR